MCSSEYDLYPYKRAAVEPCMGRKAKQLVAEGQMARAIGVFMSRAAAYAQAHDAGTALTIAQKEAMLPHLQSLAACGWPLAHGLAVIQSRDHDTKSIVWADAAFRSIGDFARAQALAHEDTLHIALHFIGKTLEQATRAAKHNPNHKPAGSPGSTGGEFDFATGGSSGGNKPNGNNTPTPRVERTPPEPAKKPQPKPDKPDVKPGTYHPDSAAEHASKNVYDPNVYKYGRGRCAAKVRQAVEAGLGHPIPAKDLPPLRKGPNAKTGVYEETRWARDYGPTFEKVGLSDKTTIKTGEGYPTPRYTEEVGDIAVIQPTSDTKHPEGHTAIYTPKGWVSDYNQGKELYPNAGYRSEKPGYVIYRKPD